MAQALRLRNADYGVGDTISGWIGHMNDGERGTGNVVFASGSYGDRNADGMGSRKRQKRIVQASDLGLDDDQLSTLNGWLESDQADPLFMHKTLMKRAYETDKIMHSQADRMRQSNDRIVLASASVLKELDDADLDAVQVDEENETVSLLSRAPGRSQDVARSALANTLEPKINSMKIFAKKDYSRALKDLSSEYLSYKDNLQRVLTTYAGPELRQGYSGSYGNTSSYGAAPNQYQQSLLGDANAGTRTAQNSMLNAMTGETNTLGLNGMFQNLPVTGQLFSGWSNTNPGDGFTQYRVTYQQVLEMWINVMQQTTLIDSVSAHMTFIRAIGSVIVVPQPFQIMKMSMKFDKGFADASAEETTFTEMTMRTKSEKRGFTQMGKAIRGTLEALMTPLGRESLALKSIQLAAAMAQTIEANALLALLVAAMVEETREEKPRTLEPVSVVVNRLCQASKMFGILHRDPQAYLTMIDQAELAIQRKGVNPAGRQKLLIVNQHSRGIVGKMRENISFEFTGEVGLPTYKTDEQVRRQQGVRVTAIEAPIFDYDRYNKLDYMTRAVQLGEFVPFHWDICGRQGLKDSEYSYRKNARMFKHHAGGTTRISMDQLMTRWGELYTTTGLTELGQKVFHVKTLSAAQIQALTFQEYILKAAQKHFGISGLTADDNDYRLMRAKVAAAIASSAEKAVGFTEKFATAAISADNLANPTKRVKAVSDLLSAAALFGGDAPGRIAWLVENDVPLFANFYIFAPHITYKVGDHLYYAKAANSFVHLITNPLVARQQSADFRNYVIVARMDHGPVVFEGECLQRIPHTNIMQYIGGDEPNSFWLHNNHNHLNVYEKITSSTDSATRQYMSQLRSMFIIADVAGNPIWDLPIMDASGKFSSKLNMNVNQLPRLYHYETHDYYTNKWHWSSASDKKLDMRTGTTEAPGINTLMFLRDHFELDAVSGNWIHHNGQGHRGRIINDPNFANIINGHTIDAADVNAEISKITNQKVFLAAASTGRAI